MGTKKGQVRKTARRAYEKTGSKSWLDTMIAPETGMRVQLTYKSRAKKRAKLLRSKGIPAYVRKGKMKQLPSLNWGVWRKD